MYYYLAIRTLPYFPRAIVLIVYKAGLLTRSRSNCLPVEVIPRQWRGLFGVF